MKKTKKMLSMFLAASLICGLAAACSAQEEADDGLYVVTFDLCTDLDTTNVNDVEVESGGTVSEPTVTVIGEDSDKYDIGGWYTDAEYTTAWDFENDVVTADTTLYAKWLSSYTVTYHTFVKSPDPTDDVTEDTAELVVMEGDYATEYESLGDGFEILGYYADEGYSQEFDFAQPITEDTDIYMELSEGIYYDADSLDRALATMVIHGTQENEGKEIVGEGEDAYLQVNYGTIHNNIEDSGHEYAGINATGLYGNLDVRIDGSQHLTVQIKNYGDAELFVVYAGVMAEDLTWANMGAFKYEYYFSEDEKNMTEEDDWLTLEVRFDELSVQDGVSLWATGVKVGDFRIDAYCWPVYTDMAKYAEPVNNVIAIKSITGSACDDYK